MIVAEVVERHESQIQSMGHLHEDRESLSDLDGIQNQSSDLSSISQKLFDKLGDNLRDEAQGVKKDIREAVLKVEIGKRESNQDNNSSKKE